MYQKYKNEDKKFEIIFCSWDNSLFEYDNFIKRMPWYMIPYEDEKIRNELKIKYHVTKIPAVIIFDEKLNILNSNAYI